MSKIQISELQASQSELSQLNDCQTGKVVGGYGYYKGYRNDIANNIDIASIVQINNNINIQIAFGGDNYNVANLRNNAGAYQD